MESLKLKRFGNFESIILPELNSKVLRKLSNMAKIKCWNNICVSDNLRENEEFVKFVDENSLKLMDGKWLFKHIVDKVVEYLSAVNNEVLANQEISILCNNLDEVICEQISRIAAKVKIVNILTNNHKQFKRLEDTIYANKGIILNISNNYKKVAQKSNIVVNFDFDEKDLKKCIFKKNSYIINIDLKVNKKIFEGKNIVFYEIDMPEKYLQYQEIFGGFNKSILYESFIYKKTSYRNINRELQQDELEISHLEDFSGEIIKKSNENLAKKLDKITI